MFSALAETLNRISLSRIPQRVGGVGIWAPLIGSLRNRWASFASRHTLLTDHRIPGQPLRSEPDQEKCFKIKPSIRISRSGLLVWLYLKHCLDVMASDFRAKVP